MLGAGECGSLCGDCFDFVAVYLIPEDLWYIIPARLVLHGRMGAIVLSPSVPGHKWEPYLEAWSLLRGESAQPVEKA